MTPSEEARFAEVLRGAVAECIKLGYRPTTFMQMLESDGAYIAASRLMASPRISEGFVKLALKKKLDLTVEALVLEKGWAPFFDAALVETAKKRLKQAGYQVRVAAPAPAPAAASLVPTVAKEPTAGLAEGLSRVLNEYPAASGAEFAAHPLAVFIRNDLRDLLRAIVEEFGAHLIVKGSAGQGTWARGPWLGIFNPIVTAGAQSGYYVCFLFREDMRGVYLSLNQGMTEAKSLYKSDAKTALFARAQNFRALLGSHLSAFDVQTINLAPSTPSNDTAFYEAGNICSKFYQPERMPSDAALKSDLQDMLALYEALIEAEAGTDPSLAEEGEGVSTMVEDGTRLRIHKRIERNGKLVQQVKKQKGTRCEVCDTDFGERYGKMGAGYIEAHHLRPLASLKGAKVHLDPKADFAVLCANCHRMVHRSGLIDDIERFRSEHFHG